MLHSAVGLEKQVAHSWPNSGSLEQLKTKHNLMSHLEKETSLQMRPLRKWLKSEKCSPIELDLDLDLSS